MVLSVDRLVLFPLYYTTGGPWVCVDGVRVAAAVRLLLEA